MADYIVQGTCRFCGQVQMIKAPHEMDGEEANQYIMMHCRCADARRYREKLETERMIREDLPHEPYKIEGELAEGLKLMCNAIIDGEVTSITIRRRGETIKAKAAGFGVRISKTCTDTWEKETGE